MAISLSRFTVPPTGKFDNHSANYKHITVLPLASALGAEIQNVNLAELKDEQFSEIESALYKHKMIYFRNQVISHDDQESVTQRFGNFGTDAYTSGIDGHDNIQRVVKEADEQTPIVFGGNWHTDSPFLAQPPSVSLLYAVDVPPYGGDTLWANTELAYDFLSPTMKNILQPLKVRMSAEKIIRAIQGKNSATSNINAVSEELEDAKMMSDGALHPLIRTHPVTNRKSLYVDQSYSMGIDGMTEPEATALISFLVQHITQTIFTCRLRWQNNTFVMWDNRSSLHHAFNDYDGFRREMYRTIVEGEIPV